MFLGTQHLLIYKIELGLAEFRIDFLKYLKYSYRNFPTQFRYDSLSHEYPKRCIMYNCIFNSIFSWFNKIYMIIISF